MVRNAAISVGETIALALLLFINFAVLLRVFDQETVGLWLLVNALLNFSRVGDFWSRGLSSFVGEARGRGNLQEAFSLVHTAVFASAAGYLAICVLAVPLLSLLSTSIVGAASSAAFEQVLPLIAVSFWLMSVASVYQAGFLGFERPIYKVVQTVGGALAFLLFIGLIGDSLGLSGLALAQLGQGAFMLAVSIAVFLGMTLRRSCRIRIERSSFRRLIGFGARMLGVGSLQLAIEPVSRLLVIKFGSLSDVTVYEMASRLVMQFRAIILAAGQVLVPVFAKYNDDGEPRQREMYTATRRIFVMFAVPGMAVLIALSPPLEVFWVGADSGQFPLIVTILALGWLFNIVAAPAFFLCLGQRQLRPLFFVHAIMTFGAIGFGILGGLLIGVHGAIAGIGLSVLASSIYMIRTTEHALAKREAEKELVLSGFWISAARSAVTLFVATGGTLISVAAIAHTTGPEQRYAFWALVIATTISFSFNKSLREVIASLVHTLRRPE